MRPLPPFATLAAAAFGLSGLAPLIAQDNAAVAAEAEAGAGARFYAEKIHPMLEAKCFKCHGADDHLKSEFRITSREGLLRGGEYGPAFDEAQPSASLLLEMVSYKDADHQMPPKAKLADEELALLAEWFKLGAPYDPALEIAGDPRERHRRGFSVSEEDRDWWAFRPVSQDAPPAVENVDWAKNPIDAFVFARLHEAGLEPNELASPRTLIRRLSYDLLGLPPSPEEVETFAVAWEADADAAWQALVEDYLGRPQYGEKWARHWLDIVRYAESNGFERDNPKPEIWRYRDYVIDAFNSDKPYDRFVVEQLAGDEIPEPTEASLTATGYHRLMQWDDEPADRRQHVYDVLADSVLVTSEAFLAITLNCARCHDHKADPLSQKDYYSFMAFFHGIEPYRTEGTLRPWADAETLAEFEKDRDRRLAETQERLDTLEAEMIAVLEAGGKLDTAANQPAAVTTFVDDARGTPATWSHTFTKPAPGWQDVGQKIKDWTKSQGGFGTTGTPDTFVTTEWKGEAIWMRTDFGLQELPETLVMEIYHDEDVEVYLNGAQIFKASGHVTDYQVVELGREALDALQTGKNVLAVHCRNSRGGQFIDLSLRTGAQNPRSLVEAVRRGGGIVRRELQQALGQDVIDRWNGLKGSLTRIRKEVPGTPLNVVTETGPQPEQLHVHLRGSAHALGDPVEPGTPAVLGSGDEPVEADITPVSYQGATTSGRRLALARWMVDAENPLTSRVMVNRIWQHHFGNGLVASTSDFGQLGERPTHPELLDFLAAEFIRQGWSMKSMHRLILGSRTYRLSSEPDTGKLAADPQNLLRWRFDMRRLTAEELRDSVLAVSGKLNLKQGGPWVYPPLPPEVLATASRPGKGWPISTNKDDHFRRSVYVHVKRSLRHQMLLDFDQAETDSPCAVRFATTVPTQALAMLNSGFTNRQADYFAERLRGGSASEPRQQIARALALALQRPAADDEIEHCLATLATLKNDHGLSDEQAMDRIALIILNLNEFIYLD